MPWTGYSLRHSISLRLTLATILLSLLVALAVTAMQVKFMRQELLAAYQHQLDEIGRSDVPALESGLWQIDDARVKLLLASMARIPGVGYIRLHSEDKTLTRGNPRTVALMSRRYPIVHTEAGASHALGTLQVVIDRSAAHARLRNTALRDLLVTSTSLLAASIALILLLRYWVTRNLRAMAEYTRKLDLHSLENPLVLPRQASSVHVDELGQVARALNHMRERIRAELGVRAQQERELKLHREHLEWMVKERTAELERKTLELDRQHRKMQELANTDSLTGACSRRHFLNLFQHELQRARRSGEPLAVLMLDVDHFKHVNDRHGHATGDRVLTLLVRTCRDELRAIDVIGRLGGEEFAIVLPQASQAKAMTAAERLRAALAALSLQNDQGESFGFTVSIGVSQMLGADDDETAILARADQQLYRAKRQGRNRVCAKHTCHD